MSKPDIEMYREKRLEIIEKINKAEEIFLKNHPDEADARGNRKVEILAVSKFHSVSEIKGAAEAGFRTFGENRVQELLTKLQSQETESLVFDLIGTLQTNKVKSIIGKVRLIHSADRIKLIKVLDSEAGKAGIKQEILLQLNFSEEKTKHGAETEKEYQELLSFALKAENLRLRGLMTMAAPGISIEEQDRFFSSFFDLYKRSKAKLPEIYRKNFDILSMGMTDDYESAVRNGSTLVRIGRAIFGERAL